MTLARRVSDVMAERMWAAYQVSLKEIERERKPEMKGRRHESYLELMARATPETSDQDAQQFDGMFGQGALQEEMQAAISQTMRKMREVM